MVHQAMAWLEASDEEEVEEAGSPCAQQQQSSQPEASVEAALVADGLEKKGYGNLMTGGECLSCEHSCLAGWLSPMCVHVLLCPPLLTELVWLWCGRAQISHLSYEQKARGGQEGGSKSQVTAACQDEGAAGRRRCQDCPSH